MAYRRQRGDTIAPLKVTVVAYSNITRALDLSGKKLS